MKISGFEALARWVDPDMGVISPKYFMDIAEETGLIAEIGQIILEKVVKQIEMWNSQGITTKVAVNISAQQITEKGSANKIIKTVSSLNDPSQIEIEITETSLMKNRDGVARELLELQKFGIKTAIDDFGTGYSSLSYIQTLPLSKLKIDKSFIDGINKDKGQESIVKIIIDLTPRKTYTRFFLEVSSKGISNDQYGGRYFGKAFSKKCFLHLTINPYKSFDNKTLSIITSAQEVGLFNLTSSKGSSAFNKVATSFSFGKTTLQPDESTNSPLFIFSNNFLADNIL